MLLNLPTKKVINTTNLLTLSYLMLSLVFGLNAYAHDGKTLYQQCEACHGVNAEGNSALGSPALAGQHSWYTERQLSLFKSKLRGAHSNDSYGNQMVAIVQTLDFDKDVPVLANYLASLPLASLSKPDENKDRTKSGYRYFQAKCGACHGAVGEGNEALKAPRLTNQSTDYLQRQMNHFMTGVRGTEKEDKLGRQMAMITKTVSEQELADILFFIAQQ